MTMSHHPTGLHGTSTQVMVQRRWLRLGLSDGTEGVVAFNTPPSMLKANSADCIMNGLRLKEPIAREVMFRCARFVAEILECDGARANLLVMKRMLATKASNSILYAILCLIHALSLVTGSLLVGVGDGKLEMVNSMYCISMLFRSSGAYVSFLEPLEAVVRAFIDVRHGVPDPACRLFAETVVQLIGWDVENPDVQELLLLLNGPWWDHDNIVVYGKLGCNIDEVVREVTSLLYRVIFACMPDVPMPSRWTKVFDSLKSYVPSFAIHGIFIKLYRWAYDKSYRAMFGNLHAAAPASPRAPAVPLADIADEGAAEAEHVASGELLDALSGVDGSFQEFKQKLGVRRGKGLAYVIDNRCCDIVPLHGLTIAPLNYILTCFLKTAGVRGQRPLDADVPVLLLDVTLNPR
jgi:hypothetical protein